MGWTELLFVLCEFVISGPGDPEFNLEFAPREVVGSAPGLASDPAQVRGPGTDLSAVIRAGQESEGDSLEELSSYSAGTVVPFNLMPLNLNASSGP